MFSHIIDHRFFLGMTFLFGFFLYFEAGVFVVNLQFCCCNMPKNFQLLLFFFFLECLPLPPQLDSVLIKQISHVGNVVSFLFLYQPLHFTLSYILLSENETRGAQTNTQGTH